MNIRLCIAIAYFWIATIALTNTASQAMQPRNEANVSRHRPVVTMSEMPVAGLNKAAARNPHRGDDIKVPDQLASNYKSDLTTSYDSSSLECVKGCPLSKLPKSVDLFASLIIGPIHLGPTESDGCVVVLRLPSRQPTRDTPRNFTDVDGGRHWWFCLVGVPRMPLKMPWRYSSSTSIIGRDERPTS